MNYNLLNYTKNVLHTRIKKANSQYIWDEFGNKRIDFYLGAGSQILGHSNVEISNAFTLQLNKGIIYAGESEDIHLLCEKLTEFIPEHLNNFIFCSSGTEATMRALRYARLSTGKDKIACFRGGWHGMNEWTLLDSAGRVSDFNRATSKMGIPNVVGNNVIELEFNCEKSLDIIKLNKSQLACVILEPVPGSCPLLNLEYLKQVEKICNENGIVLIFDEIITGFRLSIGGISKLYGIRPDIITYGKILGGGLPVGLVAMSASIVETTFRDKTKTALAGGTFSANPLVSAVSLKVLEILKYKDYSDINEAGNKIRKNLNNYFVDNSLPLSMIGVGSVSRLIYTNLEVKNRSERDINELNITIQNEIIRNIYNNGIYWPPNGIIFNGFCHSNKDIDLLIDVISSSVNFLKARNYD